MPHSYSNINSDFSKKILRSRKHDLKTTHITFQGFHVQFNTCPETIFLKSAA